MTHFWPDGDPLFVTTDDLGDPEQIIWRGKAHVIEVIVNHWIVDEDWWVQHIWREYYTIATDSGLLLTVFYDLIGELWLVQRLYD